MRDLMKWMRDIARQELVEMEEGPGVALWIVPDLARILRDLEGEAQRLRKEDNRGQLAVTLKRLGFMRWVFANDLDGAVDAFQERLQVGEQIDNARVMCTSLDALATIHSKRGEQERAFSTLTRLEDLCRKYGDLEGLGYALEGQVEILHRRGELEEASERCLEWEATSQAFGDEEQRLKAVQMSELIRQKRSEGE